MPRDKDVGDTPDDDASSGRGDSMQPDEGQGKGGASSQIRKAQNRIAQREFRLRKQIRDLEARVEVLSGDKEERVELMTLLVRNLLKENKELRGMVKSMASFVGEGLGSCLPRLGLSADGLDAILNRADTDTAYEAFINLKASRELENANPGIKLGEPRRKTSSAVKRKRDEEQETPASEPPEAGPSRGKSKGKSTSGEPLKRTKSDTDMRAGPSDEYTYLFPDLDGILMGAGNEYDDPSIQRFDPSAQLQQSQQIQQRAAQSQSAQRQEYGQRAYSPNVSSTGVNFAPYPDISGFGLTLPPHVGPGGPLLNSGGGVGPSGLGQSGEPSSERMHPGPVDHAPSPPLQEYNPQGRSQGPPPPMPRSAGHSHQEQLVRDTIDTMTRDGSHPFDGPGMSASERNERRIAQESLIKSIEEYNPSDRKLEAMQLITYHLNNFRLNHDYHLPPSLRPTVVQRTVDHEHAIDGICFPAIRDRMIMLRGQYDLIEVFHAILSEFTLHGDDVLDHKSYEVSEKFIRDYGFLIDKSVVDVSNKWRSIRGDPPIVWNGPGGGKRLNNGQGPADL
ncbi:hypothetical protein IAT38_000826 [Cryptococcus sp. DSM 104549]